MTNKLSLLAFQDKWASMVDKGQHDFNRLTPAERIWFTIETLMAQVDNGGLISFYYNSYAERLDETTTDLEKIGAADVGDLLKEINALFPEGKPPLDIDERNEIIASWPEGKYDSFFDSLDDKFNARRNELEQKLIQHILTTGLNQ